MCVAARVSFKSYVHSIYVCSICVYLFTAVMVNKYIHTQVRAIIHFVLILKFSSSAMKVNAYKSYIHTYVHIYTKVKNTTVEYDRQ